jgi:mono/diheme cytochrome c family protein
MLQHATSLLVMSFALLVCAYAARAQSPAEGRKLYLTYCASCHGEAGKGDGPAVQALPVKPGDHTNGSEMNQLSDTFLREIISKGGTAVGRSFMMPGWGQLSDGQVSDLIAFIRSMARPAYNATGK